MEPICSQLKNFSEIRIFTQEAKGIPSLRAKQMAACAGDGPHAMKDQATTALVIPYSLLLLTPHCFVFFKGYFPVL